MKKEINLSQRQWKMESMIGPIFLVASGEALHGVYWRQRPGVTMAPHLRGDDPAIKMLARAERELAEYFAGERRRFDVPILASGTEFQKKVWAELSKIPYGETRSYRDIAARLGGNACRAVGTANGRNPISVIVPCHRVITSGGGLGGYAGGLPIKEMLLNLERGK